MQTHFTLTERQYTNVTREHTSNAGLLDGLDVRLVLDVVSLDAGSYCDLTITESKDGNVLCSGTVRIAEIGQKQIGVSYGNAMGIIYYAKAQIVGRMRLAARVVSFTQGEDCPEVI